MSSKILVIDERMTASRDLRIVLTSKGHVVDSAGTIDEALENLGLKKYDIIIIDIGRSREDDIGFIKSLKMASPETPIILMAHSPSPEQYIKALELKIEHYIPGYSPAHVLFRTIDRALRKDSDEKHAEGESQDEFNPEMLLKLDSVISRYRKKPGSLIPVLQAAQEIVGYLPPVILKRIAKGMRVSESEVHGVVSFYSYFTMKPRGKHNIRVCLGTACYVKSAEEIVRYLSEGLNVAVGGMTSDKKFSLETVRCLGACGLAPVVVIDKETHGPINPVKALDILKDYE